MTQVMVHGLLAAVVVVMAKEVMVVLYMAPAV